MARRDIDARPRTVAEMLEWVARHLDLTDGFLNTIADAQGKPPVISSDNVQRDLRALALFLREEPGVDAAMYERLPKDTAT